MAATSKGPLPFDPSLINDGLRPIVTVSLEVAELALAAFAQMASDESFIATVSIGYSVDPPFAAYAFSRNRRNKAGYQHRFRRCCSDCSSTSSTRPIHFQLSFSVFVVPGTAVYQANGAVLHGRTDFAAVFDKDGRAQRWV